jgi:Zn-dependent protease with chaperone function
VGNRRRELQTVLSRGIMVGTMPVKTACPHCSARLVLKHDHAPAQVKCPKCHEQFYPEPISPASAAPATRHTPDPETPKKAPPGPAAPKPAWHPGGSSADLMRAVVQAFQGQTVHRLPTWGYRFALLLSALGLGVLIVAYFACLVGIGFGLYFYATHVVPGSLHVRGRAMIAVVLMPGVALVGLAILYSLVAPLFRWDRTRPDSLLLHSGAHPVLHCFVRALCTLIASPQPDEIRLTPIPNASAARYGGFLGILGGRLVLEIGEPFFYGLELRSLAGVIAHELGHFSQATSGWLFRYIITVTLWFQEATERTGGVQEAFGEHGDDAEGSTRILDLVAYWITGLSRLPLLQFALLSRIMTFYLMRQMEYDADRYEAEVAGSAQFARTSERLSELDVAFQNVLVSALRGTLSAESELSFAQQVIEEAGRLSERDRRQVARAMAPQRAQWFDSHPSPTERIAAVARRPHPGIFQLEGPVLCLLNPAALARETGRWPTPE